MKKKRPFFLLEILIAMSLVTLCVAPLMKGPINRHKEEMERLTRMEQSRIAAWTFSEIVEKILKNEIRWEFIPKLSETSALISLSEVELKLPPLPEERTMSRKFYLKTIEEKTKPEGPIHRLIAVHLLITAGKKSRQFTYRLTVSKPPSSL